ncbi:MAG: hypothetical protein ACE366_31475 [Bradymonadia bacterium]
MDYGANLSSKNDIVPPLTAGELLGTTFTMFFAGIHWIIPVVLLFFLPAFVGVYLVIDLGVFTSPLGITAAIILITMVSSFMAQGAVTFGVVEKLAGRKVSVGRVVSKGLTRLPSIFLVALLTGVLVALGTLALVIPGIIAAMMFFVAVPIATVESGGPIEAMRKSVQMTEGYKWILFAGAFVVGIIQKVFDSISESLIMTAGSALEITIYLLAFIVVTAALRSVMAAVAYARIKHSTEGIDVSALARIFD